MHVNSELKFTLSGKKTSKTIKIKSKTSSELMDLQVVGLALKVDELTSFESAQKLSTTNSSNHTSKY